jgi:chromosome segregation ATPase
MDEDIVTHPAYIALKNRLDSAGQAMENLQIEVDNLRKQKLLLEDKNTQLDKTRIISQNIVRQQLESVNKQNNEYIEEIQRLRTELKRLQEVVEKNGDLG